MVIKKKSMIKGDEMEYVSEELRKSCIIVGGNFEVEANIGVTVERIIEERKKEITSVEASNDGKVTILFDAEKEG